MLLADDQVDRVAASVQQWLGNHQMHVSSGPNDVTGAKAENMVRFSTGLSDQDIAPLLTHLIQQGEAVAQFREVAADLEDAFLSVANAGDEASGQLAGVSAGNGTEEADSS